MTGLRIGKLEELAGQALAEARKGVRAGHGGPFGAVVVRDGRIIGRGHNTVLRDSDPTCHAEMNAIRRAARRQGEPHLVGCVLVSTSEPCPMCLSAIYWAGIRTVYYCLSRRTAATFGFSDSRIYGELRRAAGRRSVRALPLPGLVGAAAEVFRVWKRRGGKLY